MLAAAVLQLNGCEWVNLTVGKQDCSLGDPGGARPLAARVLKAAGGHFVWPS